MKKLIIALVALTFLAADCGGLLEPTKEELLTQSKGWILTAATSNPPYEMENGDKYADLFNKGYFFDYELDDVYFYETTNALKVDPGNKKPTQEDLDKGLGYDKVTTLGVWTLDYPKLTTKVPSFYDKDENGIWVMDKVNITELTANTLTYTFTWKEADKKKNIKAKGDTEYTFTLTFSKK